MNSQKFYDDFISYQIKSGINDRIYSLYKRLCKYGFKKEEHILEIGCGIGCLSSLVSKKAKNCVYEATDISPKSIEFAKAQPALSDILFQAADIVEYQAKKAPFDKILLFDVLEHIPEDKHNLLFDKISNWMHSGSVLFINLPNPSYIDYCRQNEPESLQVIDQSIWLENLAGNLTSSMLEIDYLETYSIWVENDYQFIVVKKKKPFTKKMLSEQQTVLEKIKGRLHRELRKFIYKYPS